MFQKSSPRPSSGNQISSQRSNGHLAGDRSFTDQSYSGRPAPPSRSSSKQDVPQDIDASFVSELGELNDAVVHQVPIHDGLPPGSTVVLSPDEVEAGFGSLQEEPELYHLGSNGSRRQETYPVPILPIAGDGKRSKSYDDGTRPLQALFGNSVKANNRTSDASIMSIPVPGGLEIPGRSTTKAERRRSMNPPPRSPPVGNDSMNNNANDDSRGRSISSASDHSAYYSPKSTEPGRISPSSAPHSQLDVNQGTVRSRSRSPSVSKPQPPLPTTIAGATQSSLQDGQPSSLPRSGVIESSMNGATAASSFPPRGQSLRNPRATEQSSGVSGTARTDTPPPVSSTSRPKLMASEPSFSFEPASDDEDELPETNGAPAPPPKDDSPSRPSTPNPSSTNNVPLPSTPPPPSSATSASSTSGSPLDEEMTPVQVRRAPTQAPPAPTSIPVPQSSMDLVPPALPPIRLSLHGTDFADLLKSVADGSPRVPMTRDSQLRVSVSPRFNNIVYEGGSASGSEVGSPVLSKGPKQQPQRARGDLPSDVEEEEYEGERDLQGPPSPSVLAQERIAASQILPALVSDHNNNSQNGEEITVTLSSTGTSTPTPTQGGGKTSSESVGSPTSSTSAPTVTVSSASVNSSSSRNRSGSVPDRSKQSTPSPSTPTGANAALPRPSAEQQRDSSEKLLPIPNGANGDASLRPSMPRRTDSSTELASRRLREALNDANARGATSLKLDPQFAEVLLRSIDSSKEMYSGLKSDFDNARVYLF